MHSLLAGKNGQSCMYYYKLMQYQFIIPRFDLMAYHRANSIKNDLPQAVGEDSFTWYVIYVLFLHYLP